MSQLLIRKVDPAIKERLKERARRHGRSMEAEVRSILGEAVASERRDGKPLSEQIAAIVKEHGLGPGEELERLPPFYLKSPFDDDHH